MEKIGILTLFGYNNYGNRLQMYASQEVFKNLGFDTEIIRHENKKLNIKLVKKYLKGVLKFKNVRLFDRKVKKFKKHAKKYIKESEKIYNSNELSNELIKMYDFYSIGSDQIWHPLYLPSIDFKFLTLIPKDKKITFAPSITQHDFGKNLRKQYKEALQSFNYLSIREEEGVMLMKDLGYPNVELLLDSTMTLEAYKWREFASPHNLKPKKYILTYFLGKVPEKAKSILAKKNDNYEIVNLFSKEDVKYYDIDPSEWVDYVNNANLFLTDSFHGVAFAHILKTPFVAYARLGDKNIAIDKKNDNTTKMVSRISTILKKFDLESRFKGLLNVDFSKVDDILLKEREKTISFLKKSLGI